MSMFIEGADLATLEKAPDWLGRVRTRIEKVEAEELPQSIPALLHQSAQDVPDKEALHFIATGDTLTYAELAEAVGRVAAGLRHEGVASGARVAVMLPNVREMPVTWLALAQNGAVMVPLNTRYTSHEIFWALKNSGASHLIVHDSLCEIVTAEIRDQLGSDRHIFIAGGESGPFRKWDELLSDTCDVYSQAADPGPDALLNIQYTSGTTGMPKGCMLTQRYWLTCAKAHAACDGIRYERILAANPFFYMTPQWLTLMALMQHSTLYVAPYRSLSKYLSWIRDYRIEFCLFPTEIHDHQEPNGLDAVNGMIRGSIYIHRPENHAKMEERFGFPLRTAFGMTEIGAGTFMPIEAEEMVGSGSCGIAAPFRSVRIADENGNEVSAGQSGELLVKGPGLLTGYYNNAEATRAAFHGEWFRTGDLARQDEYGFVYILGRLKDMIRRAGENIAAAEVEGVVMGLEAIRECAAIPVPDPLRGEEVKIYAVVDEGTGIEPQQIIDHCRMYLAPYKVPRYVEIRHTPLPRSAGGSKVRKPLLVQEKTDLRAGSWDGVDSLWR